MDWRENSAFKEVSWQQQGHLYGAPLYYIEYGIAQLGALQLWQTHRKNPQEALDDYAKAMTLGNTRSLPDLFSAAGLNLGFDVNHVGSLMGELNEALSGIDG
jgi:oligoendopeptidase F